MVYDCFGQLYQHYSEDEIIQNIIKDRWDFLSNETTAISYILVPKFASHGFFINDDRIDILQHVQDYASIRFPDYSDEVGEEMAQFITKVSSLTGSRLENVMKMDSKCYWRVIGRHEFPSLGLCAEKINELSCSSASSERIWSIYRFIHSRLRNRLSNEKVEKLAFVYVNCAILDKADQTNYFDDMGVILDGSDWENVE
jgi:hypothetical protein